MSDTHPKYSNAVTLNPFYWRKCDQVEIRIRRFQINIRCFEINRVFFTSYVASARRYYKSRVVSRSLAKPNKKSETKKNQKPKEKIRRRKNYCRPDLHILSCCEFYALVSNEEKLLTFIRYKYCNKLT